MVFTSSSSGLFLKLCLIYLFTWSGTGKNLLIGIEIDTLSFQSVLFENIIVLIHKELEKPTVFACIYNSNTDVPLYNPELFHTLEKFGIHYYFSSSDIPILCSLEHPFLDQYDGLFQVSASSQPSSLPLSKLPNLIVTPQLDHFYFNTEFLPGFRNFTTNLPPTSDRNTLATRIKQFISSREFIPSSSTTQSCPTNAPPSSPLPVRANPSLYHTTGACNLWWPLNETEIFVFAPANPSTPSYRHIEPLIIICPQLPLLKPYNQFNIMEEQFLLVVEQLESTTIVKPLDRIGDKATEVGVLQVQGNQFISRALDLRINLAIGPHEVKKRMRLFLCPNYASEVSHLRKKPLSRIQSRMKDLQSENSCFAKFDITLKIVRPQAQVSMTSKPLIPMLHPMIGNIYSRDIFGHVLLSLGYTRGTMVEIGVNRGHYSALMLSQWSGQNYVMIDPWEPLPDDEYVDIANLDTHSEHEIVFQEALKNAKNYGNRPIILRNTSVNAAQFFIDSTVDIVYIDGLHHYQGVWDDILAWWPKLRPGGIMAGHDYMHEVDGAGTIFTVKPAVDEFARKMNLMVYQTKDQSYPTWFIFKE